MSTRHPPTRVRQAVGVAMRRPGNADTGLMDRPFIIFIMVGCRHLFLVDLACTIVASEDVI